jgi:hypothetical protein
MFDSIGDQLRREQRDPYRPICRHRGRSLRQIGDLALRRERSKVRTDVSQIFGKVDHSHLWRPVEALVNACDGRNSADRRLKTLGEFRIVGTCGL